MTGYVVTAKVGDNSDLFPDILRLYVPDGSLILDMTYGRGVFWKKVDRSKYRLVTNDIDSKTDAAHTYDFRDLPTDWVNVFDAVVLDPPYMFIHRLSGRGRIKESIDRCYGNNARYDSGSGGPSDVRALYRRGMEEAHRILGKKCILIVKCMDQVFGGKQHWEHMVITDMGLDIGFDLDDILVPVQKGKPTMRHTHQVHARKNHSYFLVFRRKRGSTKS